MRRGAHGSSTLIVALAALTGCGTGTGSDATKAEVVATYAEIVHASYEDSFLKARELRDAVHVFVEDPSEETLADARDAWLAAREPYGQTEAYRFYGGPIDAADGPEPLINAWPLDEAYVDYVVGAPGAGIVNDPARYPDLDRDLLVSLNEAGSEENVSTGFHAIEFLLWGQDLSENGPGDRPHTDYVPGEAPNAERRAAYLSIAADLLVDHLESLVRAWAPGESGNHRARFAELEPDEAVRDILVGVGVLAKSELAGERMFTAYDNRDQEDEHSCFSDNTHRDIILNVQGIANVYEGGYRRLDGSRVEGVGLRDLVQEVDGAFASELTGLVDASLSAVESLPAPFDRAIVEEDSRPAVLEAVYTLQDLGDRLAEAGTLLGLTINTALPA